VADGTIFERKGLQNATILTDTFRRPGDAMARVQGFSDFRYAVIKHPISSLNQDQVCEAARAALPQILEILGIEEAAWQPEPRPTSAAATS
jgi:hypothetical protein